VSAPPAAADGQAIDVAADPSTDTSNASGLSLLQLLGQAAEGENSSAPLADDTVDTGTDPSADDSGSSQTDPNALALAMLSQAFAAGFAPPATAPMGAAAQGTSPSATTDATTDGTGTTGAIDANGRSSGSSAQQLVTLLAQDLAAQAQGKTDSDATRSDVASTKGFSETAGSANGTLPTADSAAQSLAQLGVASHFSRDTNLTELKAPVGSPAWNEELGGHLTWMTHRGLESGSLHVSPEHLGPVEVQITVQNGDASVWFGASHPDTRAALEQALPRLREMFASQGLTLSDSGVSREPPRNQTRSAASHNSSASAISSGSSEVSATSSARVSLGLIDTYA
jgi:flagellar hook-length control protein FliK